MELDNLLDQAGIFRGAWAGLGLLVEHDRAHALFGLAVGRRHLPVSKAGKQMLLLLAQEALTEGLGSGVAQRLAAEPAQSAAQALWGFGGGGGSPGSLSQVAAGGCGLRS